MAKHEQAPAKSPAAIMREARMALALKQNLKRRKAQARHRASAEKPQTTS